MGPVKGVAKTKLQTQGISSEGAEKILNHQVPVGADKLMTADQYSAKAFATGRGEFFGKIDDGPGKKLLAHEATHVVQQKSGGKP